MVIRIFETKVKLSHLNVEDRSAPSIITDGKSRHMTYIEKLICEYILEKEKEYGTTYGERTYPSLAQIWQLYNLNEEFSSDIYPSTLEDKNWKFGSKFIRSYNKVGEIKFKSGIDYKIGGIQLLISPDIFSISEMKMYNYAR